MKEDRRESKIGLNMHFFSSNFVPGIHKNELPKFERNKKLLYSPQHKLNGQNSLKMLQQTRKFWAKDDNILLNDVQEEGLALDKEYVPIKRKLEVADKPQAMARTITD